MLEQGVASRNRGARPLGTKASHPMLPVGVGHPRPISLSVLSDVVIPHKLHSNIAFKARLRSDARTESPVGLALELD
jgi:hypothetical protein